MKKDKKIRRKILKILYKAKSEDIYYKVHRDDLLQELNIPGKSLDFNISYLKEKGYIKAERHTGMGPYFDVATITYLGIDFIEGERLIIPVVPERHNVTVVEGDFKGVISQGDKAKIKTEIGSKKEREKEKIDTKIAQIKKRLFDNTIPVSQVVLDCLDLAIKLNMKDDIKWLKFEINGYPTEGKKYLGEVLGVMDNLESPLLKKAMNRQVEARIHILYHGTQNPTTFPFPIFVSYPLLELEEEVNEIKGKPANLTSRMPASDLPGAVEILKRDPNELVPFEISQRDYELILIKIKQELLRFILTIEE